MSHHQGSPPGYSLDSPRGVWKAIDAELWADQFSQNTGEAGPGPPGGSASSPGGEPLRRGSTTLQHRSLLTKASMRISFPVLSFTRHLQ